MNYSNYYLISLFCASIILLIYIYGRKKAYALSQRFFNLYIIFCISQCILLPLTFLLDSFLGQNKVILIADYFFTTALLYNESIQGILFYCYVDELFSSGRTDLTDEKKKKKRKHLDYTCLVFNVWVAFLLIQNLFTKKIFYIDTKFNMGEYFPVFYISFTILLVYSLAAMLKAIFSKKYEKESRKNALIIFIINLVPITGFIAFIFTVNIFLPMLSVVFGIVGVFLQVQLKEIENKKTTITKSLVAVTFGNFQFLYNGVPVKFKRSKSKELIALLIDRNGESMTIAEIAALLWDKEVKNDSKHSNVRVLIHDIQKTFEELEIHNFFIKGYNSCSINPDLITCDYYDFLNKKVEAISKYTGRYMADYSWSKETNAALKKSLKD